MSLFGPCEDCGESARLHYKPDVLHYEQSRPSVCNRCRRERESFYVESAERPVPAPARSTSVGGSPDHGRPDRDGGR